MEPTPIIVGMGNVILSRITAAGHGTVTPPLAAFSADAPSIIVKTLIIPGDKTKEGTLVKGVTALWFEILRMIQADPDSIHQIGCWKWEEIVAGAYNQEGWEIVVLTPKRGDKGRDIIAERKDWGATPFPPARSSQIIRTGPFGWSRRNPRDGRGTASGAGGNERTDYDHVRVLARRTARSGVSLSPAGIETERQAAAVAGVRGGGEIRIEQHFRERAWRCLTNPLNSAQKQDEYRWT